MAESRRLLLLVAILLAGCARYTPAPLPAADPAAWSALRLDDETTRAALDSAGGMPEPGAWQAWELSVAAWRHAPTRTRVRAELAAADAARRAAGVRPAPGVATETEYSFSGQDGSSRWGLALSGLFRFELGDKRGARRARAEAGWLRANAAARSEAWRFGGGIESAAEQLAVVDRQLGAAGEVVAALDSVATLARRRYDDGVLGTADLAQARAARGDAAAAFAGLRRERSTAQAAIATAAGVPASALARLGEIRVAPERCPAPAARDSLLAVALERRWDLREVLATYDEAEAEVRLEVSRSWPDLELGPGLFFDHGVGKWTLAFGLPDLVLHNQRGPIAVAEAARAVQAARVREAQAAVLAEVEAALEACRAVVEERQALDLGASESRVAALDSAWQRGDIGRLEVALARAEAARAAARAVDLEGAEWRAAAALRRLTATPPVLEP